MNVCGVCVVRASCPDVPGMMCEECRAACNRYEATLVAKAAERVHEAFGATPFARVELVKHMMTPGVDEQTGEEVPALISQEQGIALLDMPEEKPMKPHEETWHWNDDAKQIETRCPDTPEYRRVGCVGSTDRVIVETDSGVYPPEEAERKLIVQAPAMARLLLELEWSGYLQYSAEGTEYPACPCCHGMRPDAWDAAVKEEREVASPWSQDVTRYGKEDRDHRVDCQLLTVLRDAKVLP